MSGADARQHGIETSLWPCARMPVLPLTLAPSPARSSHAAVRPSTLIRAGRQDDDCCLACEQAWEIFAHLRFRMVEGPEQGIFSATWRASASSPTGQAFRRMGTKARRTGQFPSFRKAQIARSSQQLTGLERRIELLGRHHFARRDPSREMVQRELAGMIKPRPPPSARSASAWWRRESLQPDVVCRLAEGAGRLIRQGNLVICSKSV